MENQEIKNLLLQLQALLNELSSLFVSGYALNALYLALILKKLSGIEITPEVEAQVRLEVIQKHSEILIAAEEAGRPALRSRGPSQKDS